MQNFINQGFNKWEMEYLLRKMPKIFRNIQKIKEKKDIIKILKYDIN